MRYTFTLSRGGAFAVVSGAVTGTALVFAAGLLVGTAAAAPRAASAALARTQPAEPPPAAEAPEPAAARPAEALPAFEDCPKPEASAVAWFPGPIMAKDLPDLPAAYGGPDPYEPDDSDGRTMGTFNDEERALALMNRIHGRGVPSFIDARIGPDGTPVFRVRTGSPEEEQQ